MPLSYASFSSCDRSYLRHAVAAVDPKVHWSDVIVLTRMYALPKALPNLLSLLIARAAQFLRGSGVRYIVTAFNPMLGFPGRVLVRRASCRSRSLPSRTTTIPAGSTRRAVSLVTALPETGYPGKCPAHTRGRPGPLSGAWPGCRTSSASLPRNT